MADETAVTALRVPAAVAAVHCHLPTSFPLMYSCGPVEHGPNENPFKHYKLRLHGGSNEVHTAFNTMSTPGEVQQIVT